MRERMQRTSSIFVRLSAANLSVDGGKLWVIAATICAVLVSIHSMAYVTVEFGMFNGKTKYSQYTPAQTCLSKLEESGFDLLDTDRYADWMDGDSTLSLAQTGTFTGPDDIKEYVDFVFADWFDLIKRQSDIISTPIRFTDDKCSLMLTVSHKYQVKAKYGNKQCLETVVGYSLHYKPKPFKMDSISLFYSGDFLFELFGKSLTADSVGDEICNIMENDCRDTFALNNLTASTCRSKYNHLPSTNPGGYLDDDTKGCRILHSAFAKVNKNHCPHLSFVPQEDPRGRIKCQKSKEKLASDFFSAYELETIQKQAHEWGFDDSMTQACMYNPDVEAEPVSFGKVFSFAGTVPTNDLNNYQFLVYAAFVMYATMVLTGMGMEYLVWRMYLSGNWDASIENKWRVAQFVFPILGATTVGLANTGNFLALPFLVVTMWKLGFPESILLFYNSFFNKEESFGRRLVEFVVGMGTVVHHSSSALYVAMLVTHVLPSNRDVVAVTLPLVMQHWFVLLKYDYKLLYIILEIMVEAWWEWTAFSTMPAIHELHWTGGVILLSMLFAHWCYFGGGALSIAVGGKEGGAIDAAVQDQMNHLTDMANTQRMSIWVSQPTTAHTTTTKHDDTAHNIEDGEEDPVK